MNEGNPGSDPQTGPQDNVPQERVQDNATWDTGGEKTPSQDQKDGHWEQVDDANADAGAGTALTADARPGDASVVGARDRNPSTYGGMGEGRPASGATSSPEKTVDGEEGV